jgi:hypothetical protein
MKHAVVNKNNVVINIIVWDGAEWTPPRGTTVVQNDNAAIGDIYNPSDNTFKKPEK